MATSIKDLDKAKVLRALFNRSKTQGNSYLGAISTNNAPMSLEEAQQIVTERRLLRFDYLRGRVMKVDLSEDEFDDWLYDRDNGRGAAAKAIASIK